MRTLDPFWQLLTNIKFRRKKTNILDTDDKRKEKMYLILTIYYDTHLILTLCYDTYKVHDIINNTVIKRPLLF